LAIALRGHQVYIAGRQKIEKAFIAAQALIQLRRFNAPSRILQFGGGLNMATLVYLPLNQNPR
jgi:hypothetical protein